MQLGEGRFRDRVAALSAVSSARSAELRRQLPAAVSNFPKRYGSRRAVTSARGARLPPL
jgi:hypothetical protein